MLNIFKVSLKRDTYYLLIIAALIIVILLMRSCGPRIDCPDGGEPIIETKIDTIYQEKIVERKIYVPSPADTVPGPTEYKDIDTLAILKDFYTKFIYEDTIKI